MFLSEIKLSNNHIFFLSVSFPFYTIVTPDGKPLNEIMDEAIPPAVVTQVQDLQADDGLTLEDSVTFLRQSLVPGGNQPCSFKVDTPENFTDKLKSLVATYRFRHRVEELKGQGVDFSTYLYIPEIDPVTGDVYLSRKRGSLPHSKENLETHQRRSVLLTVLYIIVHVDIKCMYNKESKSMTFLRTGLFNQEPKLNNPLHKKNYIN